MNAEDAWWITERIVERKSSLSKHSPYLISPRVKMMGTLIWGWLFGIPAGSKKIRRYFGIDSSSLKYHADMLREQGFAREVNGRLFPTRKAFREYWPLTLLRFLGLASMPLLLLSLYMVLIGDLLFYVLLAPIAFVVLLATIMVYSVLFLTFPREGREFRL